MNNRSTQDKYWNQLTLMVLGVTLFEFTSRIITHLEAKGDFGSPLYLILLTLTTLGLMIAVNYVLSLYMEAKTTVQKM